MSLIAEDGTHAKMLYIEKTIHIGFLKCGFKIVINQEIVNRKAFNKNAQCDVVGFLITYPF